MATQPCPFPTASRGTRRGKPPGTSHIFTGEKALFPGTSQAQAHAALSLTCDVLIHVPASETDQSVGDDWREGTGVSECWA